MKPDYKNWVPKGMMLIMLIISAVLLTCFLLFGVCGIGVQGVFRLVLGVLLGIAFLICGGCAAWCVCAYRSFSYSGKRRLSKQIVEGTAKYIRLPDKGRGLDVGCGSGALTIACAKGNPQGERNTLPSTKVCVRATPRRRKLKTHVFCPETRCCWISPTKASTR